MNDELSIEAKVQVLGEKLIELNERVNKLCRVLKVVNQFHRDFNKQHNLDMDNLIEWGNDLGDWLEAQLDKLDFKYSDMKQMRHELTHLHNEVHIIQKEYGYDGSVPGRKQYRRDRL